jgi:putative ABC transport system permease protein
VRFILAMTGREMRASWRRLVFFFLCISLGVGSIVTLRSVIQSVRQVFAGEARALLGADLVVSTNRPIDAELSARIDARLAGAAAEVTRTVEVATMASAGAAGGGAARMVELKAVSAGFPYYGVLRLEGGQVYRFDQLTGFGALVRPELLAQLGLAVGDELSLGGRGFRIRGVIEAEPGRRLGAFSLGPRVIVALPDLEQTGLLAFGSRATYQRLARVSDAALAPLTTALRADLANTFVRVRAYTATEDDMGEDFARAENYLSLVGLVVVILGGVGVSSVTRVFVQQKLKSIAVLKCIGARSSQVLAIYVAQVLALGVLGSVVGVAISAAVMALIPRWLSPAMTQGLTIDYALTPSAITQGVGTGLLVSLLFALVPLLDVRYVKPSQLLRDETTGRPRDWVRWVVMAVVGGSLVALTMWQAGSVRIGAIVAAGFVGLAVVLYGAGLALIAAVRPLGVSGWFPLRHAALQLTRPGGQVHLVLLTVGLGTFFILGVRALQENLVREVSVDIAADAPDMFLLDIQSDQLAGVTTALTAARPAQAPAVRSMPVLRARVVGVQGQTVTLDDVEDVRGRGSLAREYTVTYRAGLERNETIVAGSAWPEAPSEAGEVSIEESIRDRFGIQVGDTMRFDVVGRTIAATVRSVRRVDWRDGRAGGFMFVFRPGVLDRAPHGHIAFVRGPDAPADRARLLSTLAAGFPNVSVIDGREMLSALKTVVDNVTLAVTIVGTLVVVSGLLILIGAVAMTKFRRVYEAAILKTLGATRRVIATMLLLEYGVLGALAGVLGAAGAAGLTWALSRFAFEIPWRPLPALLSFGVVASCLVVAAVGVAASWDVLQKKPLATLRGQ